MPKKNEQKLEAQNNPLSKIDEGLAEFHERQSSDLIYESVMRGGGEPFGAPFELGTSSLTAKIVKILKQKSFFSFEFFENLGRRGKENKFTRYGAAPFRGNYQRMRARARAHKKQGWWTLLRGRD